MSDIKEILSIIWQGKWVNRMWFLTGLALIGLSILFVSNGIIIGGIHRYSGILSGVIGLIILIWVNNDIKDEIRKNRLSEEMEKKNKRKSEDEIKIMNHLGGHIMNNKKEWNITFDGCFNLGLPVCIKCKIPFYCEQQSNKWEWLCRGCNNKFDDKDPNTERQLALVKLNKEVDRAKKELGINEPYRIAS